MKRFSTWKRNFDSPKNIFTETWFTQAVENRLIFYRTKILVSIGGTGLLTLLAKLSKSVTLVDILEKMLEQ